MRELGRGALGSVIVIGAISLLGVFAFPKPEQAQEAQGATPSSAKKPDPSSADSLDRKLQTIRQRHADGAQSPKRYNVTEEEANAYLVYRVSEQLPEEVTAPWVRFSEDQIQGGAMLDMKLLQAYLGESALMKYLEGDVPVEILARVHAEGGVGQVELESVTLAGIPLPQALIDQLLSDAGKSPALPEGVRLNDVFPLPYGLTSAKIQTGRLILRQGGSERDAQASLGPPAH
jgi:hypothetical protein